MNDFNRCNKVAGVYWLKDPVENIKIKVKLKPKDGPISLPKFEDYTTSSHSSVQCHSPQEYAFKWQEKVFSIWELQRYMDVHNCITDSELTYHNMIENSDYEPSKVSTYIHDDFYLPLPNSCVREKSKSYFCLDSCMEKLRLNEGVSRVVESSSTGDLFRSEDSFGNEQWTAMHVVLDSSVYNEDSHLLKKQEATLISLYHNTTQKYVILSPDVNDLELNPYSVETSTGLPLEFQYGIELDFGEMGDSEELATLLYKLHKKCEKLHKHLASFPPAPPGLRRSCLSLEILSASRFDMDDLYVEYHVKIPDTIKCDGALHGRTHVSRSSRVDGEHWAFGHIVELGLETDIASDPEPLQIFFEVISTDWWGRHRTEGYSYLPLTLAPGRHRKQLSCSRPEEIDKIKAESRRFFVGGCHLIKDLEVLAKPQLQSTNFTYVSTGTLSIRWDVISQSATGGRSPVPSTSTSSVLVGAEAALRQYSKARARLAAVTRDLPAGDI